MIGEANHQYLIIGGVPKSGTTSLFRYISDHPQVCPSNRKETYFFARDFDLNKVCTDGETLVDFEKHFSHCHSSLRTRVEATPYTLYAKDATTKIASILPNPLMLFILRDPVKRLISDYRFHLQRDHPSTRGTLKDFFDWQSSMRGDIPSLLKMGCYAQYIRPFIKALGRNRVHILFFENFYPNLKDEIQNLCQKLRIDGSFYWTYDFKLYNPTVNHRFSWMNRLYIGLEPWVANLRMRIIRRQRLYMVFENVIKTGRSTYRKLNSRKAKPKDIFPPEIMEYLESYYRPHNHALSEELGQPIPWNTGFNI